MTSTRASQDPAIRRPGAGIPVDRARIVRLRQERSLSRAGLALRMSGGPCPYCGQPYTHKPDCRSAGEFTITPDAIAKIENGGRKPKTLTLERMCLALGCVPADLLPDDGAPELLLPAGGTLELAPCPWCQALYGHEPGCPDAT